MLASCIFPVFIVIHHLNKSYQSTSYEVTFTGIAHKEFNNLFPLSKCQCCDVLQLTGNIEIPFSNGKTGILYNVMFVLASIKRNYVDLWLFITLQTVSVFSKSRCLQISRKNDTQFLFSIILPLFLQFLSFNVKKN